MKQLWAPWRMKFLEKHNKGCVFCNLVKQNSDQKFFIIFRGKSTFVVLNRYPYTSGHILVVANLHHPSIENMETDSQFELMSLITKSVQVLRRIYKPDGFNIGANIGKSAGAGIDGHLHFHIVPRWAGDANFMETLAGTKIIPESLEDTYRRIQAEWK
jgi:ATP adenylyltransferase